MLKTATLPLIAAVLLLLLTGCHAHRPVAPGPVPDVSVIHYAGSPLSEGTSGPIEISPEGAYAVDIRAYLLPSMPHDALKPFAASSNIMTSVGTRSPLLALPSSLATARMDSGDPARAMLEDVIAGRLGLPADLGSYQAALAAGLSARMTVTAPKTNANPGDLRQLQIVIYRPDQDDAPLRVALMKQAPALVPPPPGAEDQAPVRRSVRETAIASATYTGVGLATIAVVAPFESSAGEDQAVLFVVQVSPASHDALHLKAVEQARRDLSHKATLFQAPSFETLLVQSVLRSAESKDTRRAALAYLATQTQATIFGDMILVADDAVMQMALDELTPKLASAEATLSLSSIGWTLDREAFDLMGKLYVQKKLPQELRAVLTTHAGQAGRSVASLEQLIGKTVSRRDLRNRLIAENYIFLEDISPAARVRAYDWLKAAGQAPAGFDPLGSPEARKTSLEAAIDEMSKPATGASK